MTNGRIITFYSYKGGLGRSMTLANVAWILASNGKRVLAIDWHLDGPGLHRYFAPFLLDPMLAETRGVIEFVTDYTDWAARQGDVRKGLEKLEKQANILRYAVSLQFPFLGQGGIDLVGAGRSGPSYSVAVNSFNWTQFFTRLAGAEFLEATRRYMHTEYDYVLVDCQPGTSQVSSLCVMSIPDVLVVCCGLNYQNIEGSATIAKAAQFARKGEPCTIFPALMRVDWSEKMMLDEARQAASREFDPVMSHIPDRQQYWGDVEFPYTPYYSYVEVLAPFIEKGPSSLSVLSAAERLTARITRGEVKGSVPLSEFDRRKGLDAFLKRERWS
jgi:Mrp family chromosome partitioning ATPase